MTAHQYNPWYHADTSSVRIVRTPGLRTWGGYDVRTHTIHLSPQLSRAESRATLAHEMVHHGLRDRGVFLDDWFACKHERRVHRTAARRLIRVGDLRSALAASEIPADIAEDLEVDEFSLWTRCQHLDAAERGQLEGLRIDWSASRVLDLATLAA